MNNANWRWILFLVSAFVGVVIGSAVGSGCCVGPRCGSIGGPVCKDELPDREERCMPTFDIPFEELPNDSCARDLSDEGEELVVEERCNWVVCVESKELDESCEPKKGVNPNLPWELAEQRFTLLNRAEYFDFGFSEPRLTHLTCLATKSVDGRCCYLLEIHEVCRLSENPE
jgi:hypothetical protein